MIDTIRHGQDTMTAEFRSLRWSMLGLIVFLVASVVAMKGIDPTVPASTVPAVLGGPVP